jgi:hypothetical protein
MTPFADDIFIDTAPVQFLGMRLTVNMTVVRLGDGGLILHSPIVLTEERRRAVEALGRVEHLFAPNLFHHLSIGAWAEAFPEARVHAPLGLEKKQPTLKIHRRHGEALPTSWEGRVNEIPIEGCRLGEAVLFVPQSKTLITTDLLHNIGKPTHTWTKIYTQLMGFYDQPALSRLLRWTSFSDRNAARESLQSILEKDPERMTVGHGSPLDSGAADVLRRAYSFLPLSDAANTQTSPMP